MMTFVDGYCPKRIFAELTLRTAERERLNRLIAGPSMRADQERLRRPIRIFVLVELYGGADRVEAFSHRVAAASEVVDVFQVSGKTDVILSVSVERMEDYLRFAEDYLKGDANVRAKHSLCVLNTVKDGAT